MQRRTFLAAAVAAALSGLFVCLVFGNETYVREVVLEIDRAGGLRALANALAMPSWQDYPGIGAVRFVFVLVFPVALGAIVAATARRNTFLAVWTAAVAAGAVAGGLRGLLADDPYRYGGMGDARVIGGLDLSGRGATFGLLVGWLPALVVALVSILAAQRSTSPEPTDTGPFGGSPPPWASPAPPPQGGALPWAPPPGAAPTEPLPPAPPPPGQDPTRPA